jgi:C1A family cysteine protease
MTTVEARVEQVRETRDVTTPAAVSQAAASLPAAFDLRESPHGFPPIYDQSWLESCTASSIVALLAYDIRRRTPDRDFEPSRMFLYYNERERFGAETNAIAVRNCIDVLATLGVCREADWPYDPSLFRTRPSERAYASALDHRGCEGMRLERDLDKLKASLVDGDPFVCGLVVHNSAFGPHVRRTGVIPVPGPRDPRLCGHAIAVIGYDDAKQWFIFRNSLGQSWGDAGYGYLPYDHVTDPSRTTVFWMVRGKPQEAPL